MCSIVWQCDTTLCYNMQNSSKGWAMFLVSRKRTARDLLVAVSRTSVISLVHCVFYFASNHSCCLWNPSSVLVYMRWSELTNCVPSLPSWKPLINLCNPPAWCGLASHCFSLFCPSLDGLAWTRGKIQSRQCGAFLLVSWNFVWMTWLVPSKSEQARHCI
jgi:hypothetical protein